MDRNEAKILEIHSSLLQAVLRVFQAHQFLKSMSELVEEMAGAAADIENGLPHPSNSEDGLNTIFMPSIEAYVLKVFFDKR